jgi:hypothetical protein
MKFKKSRRRQRIDSFNLAPGRILAQKYEIISLLGTGWEGEVFKVREIGTGIERAAKFYFPQRNPMDRTSFFHAKKLHKLRHCPILVQYHSRETIQYRKTPITFLVSDLVEGELLTDFVKRHPGNRLTPFEALHLLHSLASGLECIHKLGEYHGDIHDENILVGRHGLGFQVKLLDMFYRGPPTAAFVQDDVCDLIGILYGLLGGKKHYAKQSPEIKKICRGRKRTLILKNFRNAGQLRIHLENMKWS